VGEIFGAMLILDRYQRHSEHGAHRSVVEVGEGAAVAARYLLQ
jgi:hypothetical protein